MVSRTKLLQLRGLVAHFSEYRTAGIIETTVTVNQVYISYKTKLADTPARFMHQNFDVACL